MASESEDAIYGTTGRLSSPWAAPSRGAVRAFGKILWEEGGCRKHGSWILLLLGLLLLLPGTGRLPLLDRDEPRFARATVEMMERGDWIVPWFNGDYRFDKPPLTYWWMWLNYRLFGVSEFGARLHSVISALLVALILFRMGGELINFRTGFWAGVSWLACLQVWMHGRLALADMPMILGLCLAQWATWRLLRYREEPLSRWGRWFWVLWLGLTLAFYAKGPVGPLVWLLGLLLYRWVFGRQVLAWRRLQPASGLLLFLGLLAVWGIPALVVTNGLFWDEGMERHVIDRGLEAFNDRLTLPVVYYLVTVFLSLFPWIGRLGTGWHRTREHWSPERAFLVSWGVAPFLIFAFYATQLPHYTLPGFPALLLLLMQNGLPGRREAFAEWSRAARGIFLGYHLVWGLLLAGLAAGVLVGGFPEGTGPLGRSLLAIVILLAGYQLMALAREFHWPPGLLAGLVLAIGGTLVTAGGFRTLSPVVRLAESHPLPEGTLRGLGFAEPSLVFYTGRSWDFSLKAEFPPEQQPGESLLYLRREWRLDQLWGKDGPLHSLDPARDYRSAYASMESEAENAERILGMNFARFRLVELGWVASEP